MMKHQTTKIFRDLHDRNRIMIQDKLIKSSQRQIFTIKMDTIGRVQSFKYLGRNFGSDNDDWKNVRYNIKKYVKSWMRV